MNGPASRRGFLRSLTTLPLIGGGVTLIGNPTKAAEPITQQLLDSYDAWLYFERRWLRWNYLGPEKFKRYGEFIPADNAGAAYHWGDEGSTWMDPSARAAVVLSAVGCDWRER